MGICVTLFALRAAHQLFIRTISSVQRYWDAWRQPTSFMSPADRAKKLLADDARIANLLRTLVQTKWRSPADIDTRNRLRAQLHVLVEDDEVRAELYQLDVD